MKQLVIPWPETADIRKWGLRVLVWVLIAYLAWAVRDIWVPLGLAFLLATVLDPVVDRMEVRGWKRGPAAMFIFFSFLLIVVGLCVLATPTVMSEVTQVQTAFVRYFPDTSKHGVETSFHKLQLPPMIETVALRVFEGIQAGFQRSSSWLTDYGLTFITNLVWVIFVPIVGFYALRDYHLILAKSLLLVPSKRRDLVQTYVAEVSGVFARYLRGLAIVSVLNGIATWLLLLALHVPSALLVGVVAGVLYSVPYIGALLTVVITAATAFVGGGAPLATLAVGLSLVLHQIVFDQIISPRILGGQVGIHPIISIVALLVGNLLLGIVGMILAVPVAACIQIGVLALAPKLAAEIEIPGGVVETRPADSVEQIAEETKETQLASDATADIHSSVQLAVEHVEEQLQAQEDADAEVAK